MPPFFYPVFFIFGLIVGSFLNSIIYRVYSGEDFLFKRSYCPDCKHKLSWQDLIPVLSFLVLKGKCRYCQQKISWQYPLVEITTAILFLLVFLAVRDPVSVIFYWVITSFLIIVFVFDLEHYIIPDKIIYPAIAIIFVYNFLYSLFIISNSQFLIKSLFCASGASIFFLAIVLTSQGKWMGLGDVKLAFLIGLFLNFPSFLVALFLAFFIGAIIGVGLVILGKKSLRSEVPFGPFLVSGTFLAMFFSQPLIEWYQSLFIF